jgi:phage head maturation protease
MADDPKKPYGDVTYADPGYQKDKKKRYPLDSEAHCRAAWSYINMPKNAAQYTSEQVKAIKGRIKSAAKKYGIDISDGKSERMTDTDVSEVEEQTPAEVETPKGPLELRAAGIDGVDFAERVITVIAVPYEQPTKVMFRGALWNEYFERCSFDGIEKRHRTIRANREHDRGQTCGKIVRFDRSRNEGLVTDVRIAKTVLGDETLALAAEDMLGASVGYASPPEGQHLDRSSMTRRITAAYLDHLSFVADPAYEGAKVLSVRHDTTTVQEALEQEGPFTPMLDQFTEDEILRWAYERFNKT